MTRWITADYIFDGEDLLQNHALRVAGDEVTAVASMRELEPGAEVESLGKVLSPGFFDIQVNGGGDVLFNQTPTEEGAISIARAHRKLGTTHCLPTIITDAPEVMEAAAHAMQSAYGQEGICGIHIEGPHISVARKGTHDPDKIRDLDAQTFSVVEALRDADIPVLLTLAPEATQPGEIARLTEMGVIVAIGHSNATFAQTNAAIEEGARLFTHLFNAMSQMKNREPGVVGAAIASSAYCSMIADGIHVSPTMLRIAIAARPVPERMILVSDAMPTVGGKDSFSLYGREIRLRDGRLLNMQGSLAGAHVTMAQSVSNAVTMLSASLRDALFMATTAPHRLMGMGDGCGLVGASVEDVVLFDPVGGTASPLDKQLALESATATP